MSCISKLVQQSSRIPRFAWSETRSFPKLSNCLKIKEHIQSSYIYPNLFTNTFEIYVILMVKVSMKSNFFCKNKICPFPKASYVFRINRKMCKFVYHLILELNEPANKNYKFGDHFWRNILLFCKTPFPKAFMKLPCFD